MLIRINSPAFAPFGGTIGRHLTTIASGFRRVCLPGTRSGTPAYRTHTGLTREWVSIFRPVGLLTRVHNLLRLPDTHTHTYTRPRGCTPVRDTWPHLRLPRLHHLATPLGDTWPLLRVALGEYVYLRHALEHLRTGLTCVRDSHRSGFQF